MFNNYLKTALRNLSRNRIFSLINIAGLSLGLASAMLIILYTKDEVSYDRFHAHANRIYRIVSKTVKPDGKEESMGGSTGNFPGPRFTAGIPEIESFVRFASDYRDYQLGNEIVSNEVHFADTNFFSVFSFPLLGGNPKTALLQPNAVVISEDMARKQFGNTDVLGKTIQFLNQGKFEPRQVTAVAKRCPQNSSIKFEILMPHIVSPDEEKVNENWFNFFLNTFIVLSPAANPSKVEAKMKQVYETDAKESIRTMAEKYHVEGATKYLLQPYLDMHLSTEFQADNGLSGASNPMYSYILSGIALFILIIACINFINLTIARSIKRAREIGIRKVVGGDKRQLMMQFMGESFVLCAAAFLLAILTVQLVLPTFNQLANKSLSLSYLLDAKLVIGFIALFLITGIMAGFYPSLVLSGFQPVQTLYGRFKLAGKNYLQKSLVVLQFSLATLLIIATVTIYSQFNYLTQKDLGYDDSNVVILQKSSLSRREAKLFKEELMKNPGIVEVAPKNGGLWGTVAKVNGGTDLQFQYETVDETYLPMFKIPIIKGRNFSADHPSDSTGSVLVNESFAKKAGWQDAIGKEVNFWYRGDKYSVVGVVKDYHFRPLNEEIGPQLFTMWPQNPYGTIFIKIEPNTITASLQHIEKVFRKMFPISPYSYKFKDLENLKSYESEAKWKQMMLLGAILTIFISCIGLFGLSVLAAEKRTKEIGIRKVLGASVSGVVAILSKDFLKLVCLSMLVAMPVAWLLANKWLQNYPYRTELSWQMFASAGGLVVLLSFVTVSFQALRAALSNPVESLRTE